MITFGVCQNFDNGSDWDRFLAWEAGEDAGPQPYSDAALMQDDLYLADLAEPLGFDSLFCIEHRVTPYALDPNPLQTLSFWAGRTTKIALGTMVIVMPWNDPWRIAEGLAQLQHFAGAGRRIIPGIGRGVAPREYASLQVEMDDARGRLLEGLDLLKSALTEDDFSWDGEYFKRPRQELRPRPLDGQALVDNIYIACGSPDTSALIAPKGFAPIIIPQRAMDTHVADVQVVQDIRAEMGLGPIRPIVCPWVFCAETEEEAIEGARTHFTEMLTGSYLNYQLGMDRTGKKGYGAYKPVTLEQFLGALDIWLQWHIVGTPEQCVERVMALSHLFGAEEFVGEFKYGKMTREQGEKNMRLFAKEVLPALHEATPADPLPANRPAAAAASV